jgi:hypothetical protein
MVATAMEGAGVADFEALALLDSLAVAFFL